MYPLLFWRRAQTAIGIVAGNRSVIPRRGAMANEYSFLNYPRQAGQRRGQIFTFDTLLIAHGSSIRLVLFALNN